MAMDAGTLKSSEQQKVEVQPTPPAAQGSTQPSVQQTVIIQPAQPNTVYVPQYNPTTAYGAPVPAPAGYTGSDLLLTGVLSFGAGILLGSLINNGNNNWGCNWYGGGGHSSSVKYNNNVYVTNNNVYPGRPPLAGYRPPVYRPPNGYTRAQDTRHDRCLIRPPGPPIMVVAESIILTTREFPRRGHTTRRRLGRPTRISPNLIFPKRARFPAIQAGLI